MLPIRQRAALAARRTRPSATTSTLRPRSASSRKYASDSHGKGGGHAHHHDAHHGPHTVEEPLGSSFYWSVGAVPFAYIVYALAQPGKDGKPSALTTMLEKIGDYGDRWEKDNAKHTAWIGEVSRDRLLFIHSEKSHQYDIRMPELISAGPPVNVPAGHYINLDKVIAHYKKEYQDAEDKKLQRLAEEAKAKKG